MESNAVCISQRALIIALAGLCLSLSLVLISPSVAATSLKNLQFVDNPQNDTNAYESESAEGYDNNSSNKGTDAGEDLASQFLKPQNEARSKVQEPPFIWDNKVAKYAQRYADFRRSDCALLHSNGPYGENIFWGGGSSWQPKDAVDAWVSENQHFDYQVRKCDPGYECGHYTQIVWKNTRRVGCARVICINGDTFITCNYDPPGNYIGEKIY